MIKVEKLDKYFNRHRRNEIHAINKTTLNFGDTGLVCILGESGSGKTTLLNTIGGLDSFSGGSITVDDEKLDRYKPSKMDKLRNRKYGYIFQNYYLLSEYTVEYNIKVALKCFDMSDDELDDRVNYVLEAVEMRRYKKKLVSELSGGQRQRVAIARALAKTPDVIFADEPTGNLDESNTLRIMTILRKISKECLVILVTHEERIAEFFADRIIRVKDGSVVEDKENTKSASYVNQSDASIYLKELQKEEVTVGDSHINIYSQDMKEPIKINVVFANGKIYIDSESEVTVEYLTDQSETKLVDDVKPEIKLEEIDDFAFNLEKVPAGGSNRLSFGELFAMARYNIRNVGRKQFFMYVVFVVSAVLMLLTLSDLYRVATVEPWKMVTTDSHYVIVNCESPWMANRVYEKFVDESGLQGTRYAHKRMGLNVLSNNYTQFKELKQSITDFSYVDMKYLDEDSLIYGRLPESEYDIVVEVAVLESVLHGDTVLASAFEEITDFLYVETECQALEITLNICGICDNDEMSVYIDPQWIDYESLTVDEYYYSRSFQIYTDEQEAVAEYINSLSNPQWIADQYPYGGLPNALGISATYKYGEDVSAYNEKLEDDISLRVLITCIVGLLSIVVLIFTMKANALGRTEELVVYRLIGIAPGNIMLSYVIETVIITAYTQLVPILIATGICKYMSGIIEFDLLYLCPWEYILTLIIGIFVVNSLVAVLSVVGIIRRPPAQLAAKN